MTEKKSRDSETPKTRSAFEQVDGSVLTDQNVQFVRDLVDCLQYPPIFLTQNYLDSISRAASFFGIPLNMGGPSGTKVMWTDQTLPEKTYAAGSPLLVGPDVDAQEKARNEANRLRIAVFGVMNRANLFVAQAKNSGFAPPANPFARAMRYNVSRNAYTPINITVSDAVEIVTGIRQYVALLAAQDSGQINFDADPTHAAQLSSVRLSLEGFGGSGDTVIDLARLLPDIDAVKAQKALDALSAFDFSKRTPKLLFTAEYAPQGTPSGVVVGWKKVPDASGYVIRRKGLFDKKEETFVLDNEQMRSSTARLDQYVRNWILSFYDSLDPKNVCSFLDISVPEHAYVTYQVQAYQLQNTSPGAIFDVEVTPFFMSQALKTQIRNQLENLDPNVRGQRSSPDSISPYPVLAHFILGDAKSDWILAAINSRQSVNRRDQKSVTRGFSYLAAQLQFLFDQSDAGKLLIPKNRDVTSVKNKISDAIVQYGVNQVVKELLQQTGALYYFEGKDSSSNELLSQNSSGGLISSVAAAIDPENAVLNTKALGSNLMRLLSGEYVDSRDVVGSKGNPNSREIVVSQNSDRTSSTQSEDGIKVLNQVVAESGMIDLTTFEGLSSFMRIVRIFSDIGPNRGAPLVENPDPIVPDPVVPPPPAPAPKSSAKPVEEPIQELSDTQPVLDARAEEERRKQEQAEALEELKKTWANGGGTGGPADEKKKVKR